MKPQIPAEHNFDYLPLIVVLICCSLIAVVNVLYGKKLRTQFLGFISPRYVHQIMREESSSTQLSMLLLVVNGLLSIGLVGYLGLSEYLDIGLTSWALFGVCVAAVFSLMLFHLLSSLLVNFYVLRDAGLGEYRYTLILLIQIIGILVLPTSLLAAYGSFGAEEMLYIGLVITIGLYAYRLVRAFLIALAHRVSPVYIILYLCTLEILPLVALFGLLNGEKVEIT